MKATEARQSTINETLENATKELEVTKATQATYGIVQSKQRRYDRNANRLFVTESSNLGEDSNRQNPSLTLPLSHLTQDETKDEALPLPPLTSQLGSGLDEQAGIISAEQEIHDAPPLFALITTPMQSHINIIEDAPPPLNYLDMFITDNSGYFSLPLPDHTDMLSNIRTSFIRTWPILIRRSPYLPLCPLLSST